MVSSKALHTFIIAVAEVRKTAAEAGSMAIAAACGFVRTGVVSRWMLSATAGDCRTRRRLPIAWLPVARCNSLSDSALRDASRSVGRRATGFIHRRRGVTQATLGQLTVKLRQMRQAASCFNTSPFPGQRTSIASSSDAIAKRVPSGLHATLLAPVREARRLPLATSQRIVASADAVARRVPSGLHATLLTHPVWYCPK